MIDPSTQATVGLSERLARLAAGSAGTPPEALARSALTLAYAHGNGPAAIDFLRSLAHRSRPDLLGLVSDSSALSRLSRQSRSRALASPSRGAAEDRRRLTVSLARLVAARLLEPVPAGSGIADRALVERRRLFAVIGWDMIEQAAEKGWDSLAINQQALAAAQLARRATLVKALKDMADPLGWIRVHRRWKGAIQVYKLTRLSSIGSRQVAERAYDLIGELADQALGSDQVIGSAAALIALADHPAWIAGTPIGSRHWLYLLALAGDADPIALGLGARALPAIRRELAAAGLEGAESWGRDRIEAALDAIAAGTDVADRLEAAEAERVREAADRLAAVEAARADRPPRVKPRSKGARAGSAAKAKPAPAEPESLPPVRYALPEGVREEAVEKRARALEAELAGRHGGAWAGRIEDGYLVIRQVSAAAAPAEPAGPTILARATVPLPEGRDPEAFARWAEAKMSREKGGAWAGRVEGGHLVLERTA